MKATAKVKYHNRKLSFQYLLKETEGSKKAREDHNFMSDFRQFKGLECGRYWLSIQGSSGHYCTPRSTIPAIRYRSMEIAIFSNRNKSGNFLNVNRSSKLKAFPRLAELMSRADGPQPTVFGYVPVDLIQDLLNYMES